MKSTFSKYLLIAAALGATTFALQSAGGRSAPNPATRTMVGYAPQRIELEPTTDRAEANVLLKRPRMAE